jgi:hypothetical protein
LPHQRCARPASFAELADHVADLACRYAPGGDAVVESALDLLRVPENAGYVEQCPGQAGGWDSVDDDQVVGRQQT